MSEEFRVEQKESLSTRQRGEGNVRRKANEGEVRADINNDLGLGSRVAEQSKTRYLNRDGTFNVRRVGQKVFESLSPYHALCTMSWLRYHTIVTLTFSRDKTHNGLTDKKFYSLGLERKSVVFMPLNWVVVHPIDEKSPLFGVSKSEFLTSDPEFMILLTATDETFSQSVHSRSSYKSDEVAWGAKFSDMYLPDDSGVVGVDLRKLDSIEMTGN